MLIENEELCRHFKKKTSDSLKLGLYTVGDAEPGDPEESQHPGNFPAGK